MKRVIALILSLFTIALLTTSVFAAGFSGGVYGDGSFSGGGFSGGSRTLSSFGSLAPSSSSLSTQLSYEALNNLAANINLGISSGDVVVLDGNIRSVTVTKRTDWNAYVITGVYNSVTYVIVNADGGRYYSSINNGYTVVGIAGVTQYYLTDRPVGTVGSGYLGDLQISKDNILTIQETLNGLGDNAWYYTALKVIDGQYRYYLICSYPNTNMPLYYVCNNAGQLYYAFKESADSGGSGDGSSFDATEVITAINSVYDALDYGFWDVCNWLEAIQDNITSFNTDVLIMSQNMTNGFADLRNVGNTINTTLGTINSNLLYTGDNITSTLTTTGNNIISSVDTFRLKFEDYFHSLGKSYPQLMTVKLSGNDNLFEWNEGDILQNVSIANATDGDKVTINRGFHGNDEVGVPPEKVSIANANYGYKYGFDSNGNLEITCVAGNGYDRYVADSLSYSIIRSPSFSGNTYSAGDSPVLGWHFISGQVYFLNGYNMNFTVSSGTPRIYFPLECNYEIGKTYTITALARLNSGSSCYFRACSGWDGLSEFNQSRVLMIADGAYRIYTTTFTVNSSNYSDSRVEFLTYGSDGMDVDIKGIKVELNDKQTFIHVAPGGDAYYFDVDVYKPPNPIISLNGSNFELGTSLSFIKNSHDKIFYNVVTKKWQVYRYSDGGNYDLPASDQAVLNRTLYQPPLSAEIPASSFNMSSAPPLFYDGVNTVDVTGDTVVTIEYYHNGSWFDYMYSMMDKLYERIGQVDGAVVNIENTVVDIVQDNDAFNVFYVEKSDGTTESVGDAAKDAAKVVGEFLSIFYRLVFEDALSNSDIIHDFEDVYIDSNAGVSVW